MGKRLTREESQERTRELLIEAARHAFARSGFGGTSVGDIAEGAGFSKGAFYSNFASKEELLLELLRRQKARVIENLRAIVEQEGDLHSILRLLGQQLMTDIEDADWALLAVELQLHAARSPSFATAYRDVHCEHREALAALIGGLFRRAGKRPPADVQDLASGFIALVQGLSLQHGSGPDAPRVSLIRSLVPLFAESLLIAAGPDETRGE